MISLKNKIFGLFLTITFILSANVHAQDMSLKRLNDSPRHHEWVQVKSNGHIVHSFVTYPEVEKKVPAVLVIHENRGLTDWVRSVADQLSEAGFIAIAPDLLSGMGPDSGKTSDFADSDAARDAIYKLDPEKVTNDLKAVSDYVKKLPACSGQLAVAGFCWGGSQTFRFATNSPDVAAAFVFYGTAPTDQDELEKINCPVYGFYGGNDARVTSTVEETQKQMEAAKKTFAPEIYDGAGHGFMRSGEGAATDDPNKIAHDKAWVRWVDLLKSL